MGEFSVSVVFEDLENHRDTASLAFVYSPNINQGRADLWKELDAV